MSFDYAASAATALSLLRQFGADANVHKFTRAVNPVTSKVVTSGVQTNTVPAVVLPLGRSSVPKALEDRLADALIQGKLRKIIFAASGLEFEPSTQDIIYAQGKYWYIQGCTPLNPAGTAIIYTGIVTLTTLSQEDIDLIEDGAPEEGEALLSLSGEALATFDGLPLTLLV